MRPAQVYVPAKFKPDDAAVRELLAHPGAADLVTSTRRGLIATLLPFVHDAAGTRPDVGTWGALLGHVARDNEQWREPARGEALVIVRGPDAYISPTWYAATQEHGRVVPTWNYITAHVYGRLVVHDEVRWVEALVRRLTDHHEAEREQSWSVDDAPPPYIAGQLRAIVGVEVLIDRVEGKFKLSQNRSEADIDGVIAGLDASGQPGLANAMRDGGRFSVPSRGARRQAR
jgi:transcriptional regulator